jgi:alpha-galactosidase
MPITFNQETKEFHLYHKSLSYLIRILGNGYLGQVHCGMPLSAARPHPLLAPVPFAGFSNNDKTCVRFEYPASGNGDYRSPAFAVQYADGSAIVEPVFLCHRIYAGKADIPGLPSLYTEDEAEAQTLELELVDAPSGLHIIVYYTIFAEEPALARHVRFVNTGKNVMVLNRAVSLSLDLPDSDWILSTFTGAWAREFQSVENHLMPGFQGVKSVQGNSGHQRNPFLLLKRPGADDCSGEALGFSLIYSGNFIATAEADCYGLSRVQLGINDETFTWKLEPGALFDTPEAIMVYTHTGINHLSHTFHHLYRTRLVRGTWRDKPRPVLLNNWEGTYFDFTEAKLLKMAAVAKDIGIELFVLDDGWFGQRDSDNSSLGDWFADPRKLPQGIAGLANKITRMGLSFGLWIEPEMISQQSRLFEAHPDWAIAVPGRPRTEQRQQYVLDMARPEIIDYLFDLLSRLLSSAPISYIKWDMNRSITEPYSPALPPDRQGEFFHRYILGVYDLYRRLTGAFPDILFESCAGGGGRFDPGMLAYAPQGWLSDDTDGLERIHIQGGASLVYPPGCWGSHVSATPNHQTGRITALSFRAMVAFFGNLGFELDPTLLTGAEKAEIARYSGFYQAHRKVFQHGRFSRLTDTTRTDYAGWQVSLEDETIVGFYKLLAHPNRQDFRLPLCDLDPAALYDVSIWEEGGFEERDKAYNCGQRGGDELLYSGLLLDSTFVTKHGDFFAELFLIHKLF